MKQLHICLLAIIAIFSTTALSSQNQPQPANGDFENWTDTIYHHFLEGYYNTEFFNQNEGGVEKQLILKTEGKHGGSNALRIETGYNRDGTIDAGMIYNTGPFSSQYGGEPFNERPTGINVVARYNLTNDTAEVLLNFKKGAQAHDYEMNLSGEQDTFALHSDSLQLPFTPDTVQLFISATPFLEKANSTNSWIEIDSLYFDGTTNQLTNHGFNNWTSVGTYDPDNWGTPNKILNLKSFDTLIFAASRTTDAVSGNYALKLTSDQTSTDFPGDLVSASFAVNGELSDDYSINFLGVPFTAKPDKVTFHYKSEPAGDDTATALIRFSKYSNGQRDTLAGGLYNLEPTATYQEHTVDLNWDSTSGDPDTLTIMFSPGNFIQDYSTEMGSTMWIDEVMLEYATGVKTTVCSKNDLATIYPVPAGEHLYFDMTKETTETKVKIYNMDGQLKKQFTLHDTKKMDLSTFEAGTYLYTITHGQNRQTGKFVVQ